MTTPVAVGVALPVSRPSPGAGPRKTARRPRFYRSLAVKMAVLALIFLAVPIIVYDRFREADRVQQELLLRSVREQGRIIAQALLPLLSGEHANLPELGQEVARFGDQGTNVRLLFAPSGGAGFYYVASWPSVSPAQLDAEREKLARDGLLDRLSATCQGELPFALRYRTPAGSDEIVTSVTPRRTTAGCWAVVTSLTAAAMPGVALGRPYWENPEVRIAAAIHLAMALLTFTTFWSIRRGLKRFADRARAIRERRSGAGSFRAQNSVPELADVAEEFDHMVEALAASARDIRRAAEDNAHAFKTPIAVIRQSLEPFRRAIDPGNPRGLRAFGLIENSLDKLDELVASARRLDEVTADLIDMPRSEIDLSSMMARLLLPHLDLLARRSIVIEGHIQPRVMVYANEEMVETVLENLVDNALSFSPDSSKIEVYLERQGGMAELLIADCGPGVPPEDLERIFDRYFSRRPTRDARSDGPTHFGIGLWIARRNVEALGGRIEADNRAPSGLAVRITLPLAGAAGAAAETARSLAAPRPAVAIPIAGEATAAAPAARQSEIARVQKMPSSAGGAGRSRPASLPLRIAAGVASVVAIGAAMSLIKFLPQHPTEQLLAASGHDGAAAEAPPPASQAVKSPAALATASPAPAAPAPPQAAPPRTQMAATAATTPAPTSPAPATAAAPPLAASAIDLAPAAAAAKPSAPPPKAAYSEQAQRQAKPAVSDGTAAARSAAAPPPAPASGDRFAVQLGSFTVESNAHALVDQLAAAGIDTTILRVRDHADQEWFIVRTGDYDTPEAAAAALQKIVKVSPIAPIIIRQRRPPAAAAAPPEPEQATSPSNAVAAPAAPASEQGR